MAADVKKETVSLVELDNPALYISRELGLLAFQHRVLEEARDERNPLLERMKFLAIVGSNLDEFFMVRVGGLKMQAEAGIGERSLDGLTPPEQLAVIRKVATRLMADMRACLQTQLLPGLRKAGIYILDYNELNESQRQAARRYFEDVVFPVLTPLAVDPGHPFPHISNLSLNLAVMVESPKGDQLFARIKVPEPLPRLVPLKRSSGGLRKDGTVPYNHYFVLLEQLIAANLNMLFPGMKIIEAHPFRVTRNADFEIQELEAADLLESMEQSVRQRRFGDVVRMSISRNMPAQLRDLLVENLEMEANDVYTFDGPLGLSDFMALSRIDRFDLKYPGFTPATPKVFQGDMKDGNFYRILQEGNVLVHHPYDSFDPIIQFLKSSSLDPNVLAIKQTLYRVGKNSPVVKTLLEAREHGKQVAVLVELKARFDEESNISWARMLEREGVHVTYGLVGLKTHSKIALVVRKESGGIRRYVHLATGNYNAVTAHMYEDIGMFTSDEQIGADATDLFNYLTGYSARLEFRKLLVAPINLRERLMEMINREIEIQRGGGFGHIVIKVNAIVDQPMIQALYRASQAGVRVDLLVRGICCLRPGLPGVSENIRVISVVGRFLEHSRIYYFRNNGDERFYLGSADLMPRNINRRVEVLFPVEDPNLRRYLRDDVLAIYLADNVRARLMQPDGSYLRLKPGEGETPVDSQATLMAQRIKTAHPPRLKLDEVIKPKK